MKCELLKNIYVINLDKQKERLDKLKKNCKEKGITFKRHKGYNGEKLTNKQIIEHTNLIGRNICSKSMIGIGISHFSLLKRIVKEHDLDKKKLKGDTWFLICEDDIEFQNLNKFEKLYNIVNDSVICYNMIGDKKENGLFINCAYGPIANYNEKNKNIELSEIRLNMLNACVCMNDIKVLELSKLCNKVWWHCDAQYGMLTKIYKTNDALVKVEQESKKSDNIKSSFNPILLAKSINLCLNEKSIGPYLWLRDLTVVSIRGWINISIGCLFLLVILLLNLILIKSKYVKYYLYCEMALIMIMYMVVYLN